MDYGPPDKIFWLPTSDATTVYLHSQLQTVLHIKKKRKRRKKYKIKVAKAVNLQFLYLMIHFLM